MHGFMAFLGRLARSLVRLVFGLALAVFVLSLLVLALLLVLGASLWALLRGRKPTPVLMFQQFRQASQRYTGGTWAGRAGKRGAGAEDVVDVQAHEVRDVPPANAHPHGESVARLP